jgi:SPP1 family predicted phage head-tail adaptor
MKHYSSADYRHSVTVQQLVEDAVRGTGGTVVTTWQTFCTARASIEQVNGDEVYRADRVEPEATHLVAMRGDSHTRLITEAMRISFTDPQTGVVSVFNIVNVTNVDFRGFRMEFTCKKDPQPGAGKP